jgi:hypothetical protein
MTRWALVSAIPSEDQVRPGWLGFLVVLALGIVTYLLWRSMNTQLKRVDFEPGRGPAAESPEDGVAGGSEPGPGQESDRTATDRPPEADHGSHPGGAST